MDDAKKVEFTLLMTELILRHGVPAAIQAVQAFKTNDPTIEEICALKYRVKDPEDYFSG